MPLVSFIQGPLPDRLLSYTLQCIMALGAKTEHRTFNIKHVGDLYGHREAVTLVTASRIHSLVVSASAVRESRDTPLRPSPHPKNKHQDKRVMMWDLLRLRHIRTLPEHTHAITALKIHSLTVILSCSHLGSLLSC